MNGHLLLFIFTPSFLDQAGKSSLGKRSSRALLGVSCLHGRVMVSKTCSEPLLPIKQQQLPGTEQGWINLLFFI